jgi:hypothetical protein
MKLNRKFFGVAGLVLGLTGAGISVPGVASAEPADATSSAFATCYGGAVSFPAQSLAVNAVRRLPSSTSYYTASSRCNDINIKFNADHGYVSVRVCWVSHGTCQQYKTIDADTNWDVLATNVLDGTRFRVEILNSNDWSLSSVSGQVAY